MHRISIVHPCDHSGAIRRSHRSSNRVGGYEMRAWTVVRSKASWVQPLVVAEIEYAGVTDDGLLRAPVFKGLRDDLATATAAPLPSPNRPAARPLPSKGRGGVPRENILQLLPDAVTPSKAELEAY